mgnify:CR=1 FL=1
MKRCYYALSILCVMVLGGCFMGSYGPHMPEVLPRELGEKDAKTVLAFFYFMDDPAHPNSQTDSISMNFAKDAPAIKEIFQKYSKFDKIVISSDPASSEAYIAAYISEPPHPTWWCAVAALSLFVIPCYKDAVAYHVKFDVYVNQVMRKRYEYDISEKVAYWVVFIPFFWGNPLLYGHTDALKAVTFQFLRDAEQDGHL